MGVIFPHRRVCVCVLLTSFSPLPAVRFGRVPKREKAKILAAMQSVNQKYQERAFLSELEDDNKLVHIIVQAHMDACDFTWAKVGSMLQTARSSPAYCHTTGGYVSTGRIVVYSRL